MEGNLLLSSSQMDSGIGGVFEKIEYLKDALNQDGCRLYIACDGNTVLDGHPKVLSYNVENASDNYTMRADYSIVFEMPTTNSGTGQDPFNNSTHPPSIESCSEVWDIEFAEDISDFSWTTKGGITERFSYQLAVTHTVDVQGRLIYSGCQEPNIPWQDARDYAVNKLGFNGDFVELSGILGVPGVGYSTYDSFNNYRQVGINKTEGSVTVTETFIVTPSGADSLPNNAVETFEISNSQADGVSTVTINGEIQGLENISYTGGFEVVDNKYSAASGYFDLVKGRLYDRANTVYCSLADTCSYSLPLSARAVSSTIGSNLRQGTIIYNYEYNSIPSACITGDCIISQNITIDDQLASDVFASHIVLGRAVGPLLQDIGTITSRVRTVNIEIITIPPTACSTVEEIYDPVPLQGVSDFISVISGDLTANNSQVFVSAQNQNWNFSQGRYTKNVSFTYTNCS